MPPQAAADMDSMMNEVLVALAWIVVCIRQPGAYTTQC